MDTNTTLDEFFRCNQCLFDTLYQPSAERHSHFWNHSISFISQPVSGV